VRAFNARGSSSFSNKIRTRTLGPPVDGTGNGLKGDYYNGRNFESLVLSRNDPTVEFDFGAEPAVGVNADNFSVRWLGRVEARYAETYTFYTTSDDGVRLWVNGQLLINNWTDHGPTENSGTITLQPGTRYTIRMDFYESGGGATARLGWSSDSQAKEIIPQSQLYSIAVNPLTNGLTGAYYDNIDLTNLRLTRTDPTVNFNWLDGSPDFRLAPDTFSARWTGFVQPQFTETYRFYTTSDDGIRLWVNGQLLIDNWTDHGPTQNSGTIALVAGRKYSIRMEFYENGGGAVATLDWESPSQPFQNIPQNRLFPR
jgi:hypothetical protein